MKILQILPALGTGGVERGTVEIAADGAASFVRTPDGNCRRQLPGSPAWNASMLEKIRSFNRMR